MKLNHLNKKIFYSIFITNQILVNYSKFGYKISLSIIKIHLKSILREDNLV